MAAARAAALALAANRLPEPQPADALAAMRPRLGLQWHGQPLRLAECTVRQGTDLQLGRFFLQWLQRQQHLEPYAASGWVSGASG